MTEAKVGKKPNTALMKPLQPSTELAAVVGSSPLPRTEVVSKVWDYIKANNLQNPENKREILADAKLQAVFGGKSKVSMLEMNKHFAQHLSWDCSSRDGTPTSSQFWQGGCAVNHPVYACRSDRILEFHGL